MKQGPPCADVGVAMPSVGFVRLNSLLFQQASLPSQTVPSKISNEPENPHTPLFPCGFTAVLVFWEEPSRSRG